METGWTVFLSVVVGALAIYHYLRRNLNYFKNRGLPYVEPTFIFGSMGPSVLRQMPFVENVRKLYNLYPDARYFGFFDFNIPVVMLRDPELIKSVTVKHFEEFHDHRQFVDEVLDPLFANNLFSLGGDRWQEVRSLLSPAFTSSKIKVMFKLMSQCGKDLANCLAAESSTPIEMEFKDAFGRYTTDVIATTVFGISVNSLKDRNNEFYSMGKMATNFDGLRTIKLFLTRSSPYFARLLRLKIFEEKITEFYTEIISSTIAMRDAKGIVRPDMIQLMMQARKDADKVHLSIEDMTSQAFAFFFGGFDTSSTLMSFAAHQIGTHPEVQKKLAAEIDAVSAECEDGEPTYDALQGMEYLDAVINETLRLYPPVSMLDRACTKSFVLPPAAPGLKPYTVEAGSNVWIPCYAVHRDPRYFGERADDFDPDRFSEQNKANIEPFTFFPFGLGPRYCIGKRFALLETKLALFHLFAKCKLSPCAKTSVPIKLNRRNFSTASENDFWLYVEKRCKSFE